MLLLKCPVKFTVSCIAKDKLIAKMTSSFANWILYLEIRS